MDEGDPPGEDASEPRPKKLRGPHKTRVYPGKSSDPWVQKRALKLLASMNRPARKNEK